MRNAEYWRGRFSILEENAHKQSDQYLRNLEDMFMDAQRTVQADIERWYGRFATNNGISLTEARKLLTTGQLEEFHWTVEQYIKAGQQNNLSAEWLKKLENASAKFHVSRLEAIQLQIQQQIELLYGNQLDGVDSLLKQIVSGGYTHGAFTIQKGLGLGWDITALNRKKLETLLSKPWTRVEGVQEETVDLGFALYYQRGWSWEDVSGYVTETINGYFLELAQSWADQDEALVVRISQIESRLLGITGILDIANTTINEKAANHTLALDYIPVLGSLAPTTIEIKA